MVTLNESECESVICEMEGDSKAKISLFETERMCVHKSV